MYVRLTPKQITKAREFLKTITLRAIDIDLFQEIQKALDSPIDEKQYTLVSIDSLEKSVIKQDKEQIKKERISDNQKPVEIQASENTLTNNSEIIDLIQEPENTELVKQPEPVKQQVPIIKNTGNEEDVPFGVIDRRTIK